MIGMILVLRTDWNFRNQNLKDLILKLRSTGNICGFGCLQPVDRFYSLLSKERSKVKNQMSDYIPSYCTKLIKYIQYQLKNTIWITSFEFECVYWPFLVVRDRVFLVIRAAMWCPIYSVIYTVDHMCPNRHSFNSFFISCTSFLQ
jgi:hypothetical protein